MSSFALPRRATLTRRPLVAALAAAVLCLALVAVAATHDEASVSKRPALARQQPSPFGDVSRTIWASDKYRGDLGRSLFLTVFGPGVMIAVLVGARCRDPPRRRRKNVPVAHATYGIAEGEAVVADASDDDELDLLPAARPIHRNPFGSPGHHNPARCKNTCVYLDRERAARLAGRGDEILPRERVCREGVARAGRDAYRRDRCQALDGRVCFYVDDVVVALRAVN